MRPAPRISGDLLLWYGFLKFYVMRSPGINLYGIIQVKVGFIAFLKLYVLVILGRFVWTKLHMICSYVQCELLTFLMPTWKNCPTVFGWTVLKCINFLGIGVVGSDIVCKIKINISKENFWKGFFLNFPTIYISNDAFHIPKEFSVKSWRDSPSPRKVSKFVWRAV